MRLPGCEMSSTRLLLLCAAFGRLSCIRCISHHWIADAPSVTKTRESTSHRAGRTVNFDLHGLTAPHQMSGGSSRHHVFLSSLEGESMQALLCYPGHYADGGSCKVCTAGLYQSHKRMNHCNSCPTGYSTQGHQAADACTRCDTGRYSTEPASVRCITCPTGYSSPRNSSSDICTACPGGSYWRRLPMYGSRCVACPVGYFQNKERRDNCIGCPIGHTSQLRGTNCSACIAGYAADWGHASGKSGAGVRICSKCVAGKFSARKHYVADLNGTFLTLPASNKSEGGSNNRSCFQCPANYYQPQPVQGNCIACPGGYFSFETGGRACRGTHSLIAFLRTHANVSESGGHWHAVFGRCAAGSYKPPNSTLGSCNACPGGYYQNSTNQKLCLQCVQGTYAPKRATKCKACPLQKAYYLNDAHSACIQGNGCPQGYFEEAATEANLKVREYVYGRKCTLIGF
jgi:hypothetical protein